MRAPKHGPPAPAAPAAPDAAPHKVAGWLVPAFALSGVLLAAGHSWVPLQGLAHVQDEIAPCTTAAWLPWLKRG